MSLESVAAKAWKDDPKSARHVAAGKKAFRSMIARRPDLKHVPSVKRGESRTHGYPAEAF